jgi:hypothetical protein
MISDQHLLIGTPNQLSLWKIDSYSFEFSRLSQADIKFISNQIVIDQLDNQKFVMYGYSTFVTGYVVDDKIVLSERKKYNFNKLHCTKLVGNNLIGVRYVGRKNNKDVSLCKFCTIDLTNLTEETVDVPLDLNDINHVSDRISVNLLY